jgi:Outer membrane protein beta-barrel domain
MKIIKSYKKFLVKLLLFMLITIFPLHIVHAQQKISFGIHADPSVNWFTTDIKQVKNDGARPGFIFGLTYNKYFTPNYAFSSGISILRTGGRLVSSDTTLMVFPNFKSKVFPGNPVVYKIQYLVFPIGLKLQTNQIGYLTFFSDLGLDPKIAISRRADIASLNISGENAKYEINQFNLSYHIAAGIEYSLGGTTALVFGLNFDNNLIDVTTDNGRQPTDNVSQKILSFRFGINF